MVKLVPIVLFLSAWLFASAQTPTPPLNEGQLSSTRLLRVERLKTAGPDQGPDGLSFCFLVSRTPSAQHTLAIKETKDFLISQRSYRELSQSELGRVFEPQIALHDAVKYSTEHPDVAEAIQAAPPRSLIVTLALSGPPLQDGVEVQITLHLGFGRTAGKPPEGEDLVFKSVVPVR